MKKNVKAKMIAKVKAKIKFYNYLLGFFTLSFAILAMMVFIREYNMYKTSEDAKNVLKTFESLTTVEGAPITFEDAGLKMGKYRVIGSIKIDAIGIDYPILERTNNESLNLSITKLSGPSLNSLGNVSLAGHNSNNGTLFSRLVNIKIDDIIEITDSRNKVVKYKVYRIYAVDPKDTDPVKTTNYDVREITLVTCNWNAAKRIIVKAIEI